MIIKPDIITNINFYSTENNGRKSAIDAVQFPTIFQIGELKYDCRLLLNKIGKILPGEQKHNIPIKFLYTDLVLLNLHIGDKFYLWDMRNIAEGIIIEITSDL